MLSCASLVLGIGFGHSVPYMYNWLDWSAPQNSVNLAITIVLVLVNVDCAASPIVLNAITPNAKTCLMISGIFFAIFRVYALIHYFEVKYKEYLNRPDRPEQQKIAQKDPERIMYAYFEVVPGQFIEMFPNIDLPHDVEWYKRTGLNHFSLTVDDIHETLEELKKAGIQVISEPSKVLEGPSETWQFWAQNPDGNHFEVQQFTDKSYQRIGHLD